MELSRNDLVKLLSVLEAEVQSRDLVIAVLRSEHIKRLICPNRLNRSLVSRYCKSDQVPNNSIGTATVKRNDSSEEKVKSAAEAVIVSSDDPLNALFRDSLHTLDPNCDDIVSGILFKCQVKSLRHLIRQQEQLRNSLCEKFRDLTMKYESVVHELETERQKAETFDRNAVLDRSESLERENERLKSTLESVEKQLESEKDREKKMILSLLSERKQLIIKLIEEKSRNQELSQLIAKNNSRISEMSEGLEEESKRSLQMELELERISSEHQNDSSRLLNSLKSSEAKNMELMHQMELLRRELQITKGLPVTSSPATGTLGEGVRSSIVTVPTTGPVVQPASVRIAVTQTEASIARSVSPTGARSSITPATSSPVTILNSSFSKSNNTGTVVRNTASKLSAVPIKSVQPDQTQSEGSGLELTVTGSSVSQMTKSAEDLAILQQSGVVKTQLAKRLSNPIAISSSTSGSRGAPPPIPPNKPVLPAQILKEKSKLIHANFGNHSFKGNLPSSSSTSATTQSNDSKQQEQQQPQQQQAAHGTATNTAQSCQHQESSGKVPGVTGTSIKFLTRHFSHGPGEELNHHIHHHNPHLHRPPDYPIDDVSKLMSKVCLDPNGNDDSSECLEVISGAKVNGSVDHLCQELADIQKLLVSIGEQ